MLILMPIFILFDNKKELLRLAFYILSHTVRRGNEAYSHLIMWEVTILTGKECDFWLLRRIIANKREKRKCKLCGGKLRYMEDNLRAFLKVFKNEFLI